MKWLTAIYALLMACTITLFATGASAFTQGTPIPTDSRIKTFVYNENDVYRLLTHYGYQLNIEFGREENIQTISVGDRTGWQITPAGNRLFVRGMEDEAHTNMTIITDKRAYQFDLYSTVPGQRDWSELVYVVRFYYPEDEQKRKPVQNSVPTGQNYMQQQYPMQQTMPMMAQPMPMMPGYAAPMPQAVSPYYPPSMPMQGRAMGYPSGGYGAPMMMAPSGYNQFRNHEPEMRGGAANMMGAQPPPYAQAPATPPPLAQSTVPSAPYISEPPAFSSPSTLPPEGFSYSDSSTMPAAANNNVQYSYTGAKALLPDHMFDDGHHTYLYYPPHRNQPNVFLVLDDGSERPLPAQVTNQYLTISGVYSRMTLRMGSEYACIYNEAKPPPLPSGHII